MSSTKYDIILIRGAPGVGKSTLSRRLKTHFPDGFIVEVDDIRGMLNSVKWVNTAEHLHALDAVIAVVNSYLKAGYHPAIVLDTFSPSKLTFFKENYPEDKEVLIISLYAEPASLAKRILQRKGGFKDLEACNTLNKEVWLYRHENEVMIDTTNMGKEEVLEAVLKILKP